MEPGRRTRVYEDKEAALGRFRYVPEQPVKYPEVLAYIAGKSLRQVEGGWTWKFDPGLFDYLEMGVSQRDKFAALPCRSAVILGEERQSRIDFTAVGSVFEQEIPLPLRVAPAMA